MKHELKSEYRRRFVSKLVYEKIYPNLVSSNVESFNQVLIETFGDWRILGREDWLELLVKDDQSSRTLNEMIAEES